MSKITGVGAALKIGTADDEGATAPGSDTFTAVGGITGFDGPQGDKGETEVTDLADTARDYLATLPDNGVINFAFFHDEDEATQTTVWGDYNDGATTHKRNWQITFSDGTVLDVKGYVKSLSYAGVGLDEGVRVDGVIRCTSAVTRTLS